MTDIRELLKRARAQLVPSEWPVDWGIGPLCEEIDAALAQPPTTGPLSDVHRTAAGDIWWMIECPLHSAPGTWYARAVHGRFTITDQWEVGIAVRTREIALELAKAIRHAQADFPEMNVVEHGLAGSANG